jgi:HD-GYP domain-containing protein (c-di-GMP phosphodiesterase class II)
MPMPPLTLTHVTPAPEDLAAGEAPPSAKELRADLVILVSLIGAVVALYVFGPDTVPADPLMVLLCGTLITLAICARFDLPLGWTAPVQLALVPTVFLLPPWLVPVTMGAAILASRVPDVVRGTTSPWRLLISPGNAWFTVGPATLLALAGSPGPAEAGVLLLIAMLAAQIGTDLAVSLLWERLTTRTKVADHIRQAFMVYVVDVSLAPVGLLAALAMDESPWYLLLMTPLFGVLAVFASERRTRLEQLTELNGAYRGTALVLAEVVDADDAYTGKHTRDVVELSTAVADQLDLDDDRRRNVEFGALLHDVGKVAIPNEILNKAGPLSDAEWRVMRTHTIEGQRMLDSVGGFMREVGAIVRGSHERWDGGGYPDGLVGDEIPLEARIVCCCDAYNAMTTTRPYRKAMPDDEAAAELVRCSGTQFDPTVVDALLAVVGVRPRADERPLAA